MNILWYLSLFLTTISIFSILIFAIPFKTSILQKISAFFSRFKNLLLYCIPVYLLIIYQEYTTFHHIMDSSQNGSLKGDDVFFFKKGNEFRAKRNFYISLLGFSSVIGLLIIQWQIGSFYNMNSNLRRRINDLNENNH